MIPSESYQIVSGRLRGLLELSLKLPELYPTVNSGVSSEGQGDGGVRVAHDSKVANVSWASNEDQGDFGQGVADGSHLQRVCHVRLTQKSLSTCVAHACVKMATSDVHN